MQTRWQSLAESITGTAFGFIVSGVLTYYIFGVTICKAAWVTAIYTVSSIVRQYVVRRAFNHWHKTRLDDQ